eukprot:1140049-Pelagomonas_calceolata.AAC.1
MWEGDRHVWLWLPTCNQRSRVFNIEKEKEGRERVSFAFKCKKGASNKTNPICRTSATFSHIISGMQIQSSTELGDPIRILVGHQLGS